jgi:hypothetical protein
MATLTITEPSIELQQYSGPSSSKSQAPSFVPPDNASQSRKILGVTDLEDIRGEAAPPIQAVEALQRWNYPHINMWRVFASFWSFLILGMNDGSYGVSICPGD